MYLKEIIGGVLIGGASALPLLFAGRIAGVSGYASSMIGTSREERKTGTVFVLGIIIGSFIWRCFSKEMAEPELSRFGLGFWALAGLLVGFGSRLAGGCTSGHGVCGLGRMSPRSLLSVLIFMSTAILLNFILRNYL